MWSHGSSIAMMLLRQAALILRPNRHWMAKEEASQRPLSRGPEATDRSGTQPVSSIQASLCRHDHAGGAVSRAPSAVDNPASYSTSPLFRGAHFRTAPLRRKTDAGSAAGVGKARTVPADAAPFCCSKGTWSRVSMCAALNAGQLEIRRGGTSAAVSCRHLWAAEIWMA